MLETSELPKLAVFLILVFMKTIRTSYICVGKYTKTLQQEDKHKNITNNMPNIGKSYLLAVQ